MRILCFGDSNTWGYIPGTDHERFAKRWPVLLRSLLPSAEIIEEGLNSRTCNSADPRKDKVGREGLPYLIPCLDSHDPLDVVIIALGLNDVKDYYQKSAEDIASDCQLLVDVVYNRDNSQPGRKRKCILIAPNLPSTDCPWPEFDGARAKVSLLFDLYSTVGVDHVIDARSLSVGSDGIHLTAESHAELAKLVAEAVESLNVSR